MRPVSPNPYMPPAAADNPYMPPVDPYAAANIAQRATNADPYAAANIAPAAVPGAITNPGVPGFFGSPVNSAQKAAVKATTDFGNFMLAGHHDPIGAFLGKLQGGQRMLQTIGTQAFGAYDPTLDPIKALMDPATAPAAQAQSDAWMGLGPGGAVSSALGSGNGNFAQKVLLGGAHAIADGVTNPISYVNPAKVAGTIADVIPGAKPALAAAGNYIGNNTKLGALFNPDYYLRGLTPEGKAQYEAVTNKAMETVRGQKTAEDAMVKKFAPQIRAGQMPPEVAALFTSKTSSDLPTLLNPGAPGSALNRVTPTMESPINQIDPKFTDKINQRPDSMSRTSGVNSSITPNASGSGGKINARSNSMIQGVRNFEPPTLRPNITPGAPGSALNARAVPNAVAPGGPMQAAFTDTMSRSAPGQSSMEAWKSFVPDLLDASGNLKVGTNPADIQAALYRNRAPVFKTLAMPELQDAGFFNSPSSVFAGRSVGKIDPFDVPTEGLGNAAYVANGAAPHPIIELQKRLEANLDPVKPPANIGDRIAQALTQRGNQAFLANPIPHTFNLMDLAYNKYGIPTVLKGAANAAQIATGNVGGDLADQIGRLEATGTKSQYGNIFNELGLTGLKNSSADNPLATAYNATLAPASRVVAKAVNVPLIAAQRASNAAQNTLLNPLETGLRAAAMNAEQNAGTVGDQIFKNVHSTFGTDAPNRVTSSMQNLAVPFAKFHFQTAPGNVLNTLANNPGRIVNTIQTERDMNNATGANYRSTVPGANAPRMLADPLTYFGSPGGLLGLEGPFSILSQSKKGALLKAIGSAAAKFTPGSQPGFDAAKVLGSVGNQVFNNGPQPDYSPLFNAAFGGFTAKR